MLAEISLLPGTMRLVSETFSQKIRRTATQMQKKFMLFLERTRELVYFVLCLLLLTYSSSYYNIKLFPSNPSFWQELRPAMRETGGFEKQVPEEGAQISGKRLYTNIMHIGNFNYMITTIIQIQHNFIHLPICIISAKRLSAEKDSVHLCLVLKHEKLLSRPKKFFTAVHLHLYWSQRTVANPEVRGELHSLQELHVYATWSFRSETDTLVIKERLSLNSFG